MLQRIPAMPVSSGEDRAVCVTSHRALASSQQLGIGHIFPDPESELETPAKARREKRMSEQSKCSFFTNVAGSVCISPTTVLCSGALKTGR